ncbi:hypothetical protein [Wolbachia endosymbiont of Atemnus politus]|uniref:hypothetical protein n=1 Tax=Wolbachia endosymbiont of Atemnus politus TaxID=2682840 RepID=UPI0015734797|nr:hypothetical protein [Wolbachia endosymbiont of Atemnus politus]
MKGVKLALSLNNITNNLKKLFSRINPFRNTGSSNLDNDQVLNHALGYVVKSLDYDAMVLLINAGANVNAMGDYGIKSITQEYKRASALEQGASVVQIREFFTEYKKKMLFSAR